MLPHSYSVAYRSPGDADDPANPHCAEFHLRCSPRLARLRCSGELDHGEGLRLGAILTRLEGLPTPVQVSLRRVSFCDSNGLAPLFESTRRRTAKDLPPLHVNEISDPVGRVLGLLGIRSVDPLDLVGWDAAALSQ